MAKTIKDMAYKSLLEENVKNTESDYSRGYLIGYSKGANAVLEEFINCLGEFSNTEDYCILQRKIKKLKGE